MCCIPFLGRQLVVVNSHNLLSELCDDKRFPKLVTGAVKEISALVHDGLFTYVDCTPPQPQLNQLKSVQRRHERQELGYRPYAFPPASTSTTTDQFTSQTVYSCPFLEREPFAICSRPWKI